MTKKINKNLKEIDNEYNHLFPDEVESLSESSSENEDDIIDNNEDKINDIEKNFMYIVENIYFNLLEKCEELALPILDKKDIYKFTNDLHKFI